MVDNSKVYPISKESKPVPTDSVAGADSPGTKEASVTDFIQEIKAGHLEAGVWSCSPGTWPIANEPTELCTILDGLVAIESKDGLSWEFGVGDSFVLPAGFVGRWTARTAVRKIFFIGAEYE